MTLYMHVILFFICLNFGLGITTIPDTPLHLEPPANSPANRACFHDFQSQALITPTYHPISTDYPDTNGDGIANDHSFISGWTAASTGIDLDIFVDDGSGGGSITGNMTGGFNPITEAIESSYQAGETLKNVFLGGYITNILGSLSMQCDTDASSANFGSLTVSPVMSYIIYFINIVFGIMLLLALIYLITGKSFGF